MKQNIINIIYSIITVLLLSSCGTTTVTTTSVSAEVFEKIETTQNEWTWVDFPNAFCANGQATGIGINPSANRNLLLIYLDGGGLCYNEDSCYISQTAANVLEGYTTENFTTDSSLFNSPIFRKVSAWFQRSNSENPFKEASLVYVPYCTGDFHSGNRLGVYGDNTTHHVGFANFKAYLERLVPTFNDVNQVIISGNSAGGYGAAFNWYQTQMAFGAIHVNLIDDSGPWLPNGYFELLSTIKEAWGSDQNLPAGCKTCADDYSNIYAYTADLFPKSRGGLISYIPDSVISRIFSLELDEFTMGMDILANDKFLNSTNLHTYYLPGYQAHTVLGSEHQITQNEITLIQWVIRLLNNKENWDNVTP